MSTFVERVGCLLYDWELGMDSLRFWAYVIQRA
jgi:hypothetical protein